MPSPNNRELPQLRTGAKQAAFLRHHHPPPAVIRGTHSPCIQFSSLLPLIFRKPLAAGLCFQTPPGDRLQTFTAVGATTTTPHIRRPPGFLYGGRTQGEMGCDGSCLAATVWKQDAEPEIAAGAGGRKGRETSTPHGASLQAYTGLHLKGQHRLNA